MKSVSHFDSSYSPNEAREASDIPNCGACYDDGMIDEQVYCDCSEGDKRMDSECAIADEIWGCVPDLF